MIKRIFTDKWSVTVWPNGEKTQIGHNIRHESLLHDIIQGKMMGKTTCGRIRTELLHDGCDG